MVTVSDGWLLFIQAFMASKRGDIGLAAEWMYRLNVFARSVGRVSISEQIYDIKNAFIKFLYQNGYAVDVKEHKQEFECWGSYMYGCGEHCEKCGGTGVYRTERLYSFHFLINGMRFSWHQPVALVDYTVVTFSIEEAETFDFTALPKDEAILDIHGAWLGCCIVWWTLAFHWVFAPLILWRSTRNMWMKKSGLDELFRRWRMFKTKIISGFYKQRVLKYLSEHRTDSRDKVTPTIANDPDNDCPF